MAGTSTARYDEVREGFEQGGHCVTRCDFMDIALEIIVIAAALGALDTKGRSTLRKDRQNKWVEYGIV